MYLVRGRNAHTILPNLAEKLLNEGIERESRYGTVKVLPEPCTIIYEKPLERVVFWRERDGNPFFHLIEAIWMLAGRRDVKFIEKLLPRMKEFSDDGKLFNAAYGYRWRKHFGLDQVTTVIEGLKRDKDCRRQVIGIWDTRRERKILNTSKDIPCNISATFQISANNELDMVVQNRSNDLWLGATGANCVHFSILQEYIAYGIGVAVGKYWQVSSNMHGYLTYLEKLKDISVHHSDPYRTFETDPYKTGEVFTTDIFDVDLKIWEEDLAMWMKDPLRIGIRSQFFTRTATPMIIAHRAYKKGKIEQAIEIINSQMTVTSDWAVAAKEWLQRRRKNEN